MGRAAAGDDRKGTDGPRAGARAAGRSKHSVCLDAGVWRRLRRLAVDLDTDCSALIGQWVAERLDRYERAGRDLGAAPGARPGADDAPAPGEGRGAA